MWKPGKTFWKVVLVIDAICALYALIESAIIRWPKIIWSLILPPIMLRGIYIFLLLLGLLGMIALNWEKILKLITRKKRQRLLLWDLEKQQSMLLGKQVEEAYLKLRNVCEPGTLNPKSPGNPIFMKAEVRDLINPLRPAIQKAGYRPPKLCTTEDESLGEWFTFLGDLRSKEEWIDLMR